MTNKVQEENLHPISALQHAAFCPRQAALIHLDQVWEENKFTSEGRSLHERVDNGYKEFRKGLRQFSSVRVQSLTLGIYGCLDIVEVEKVSDTPDTATFLNLSGNWKIFPVEFKRGKPKQQDCDEIQLCAQALCLEEMTSTHIPEGSIFYGQIRRRVDVPLTDALRDRTLETIKIFDDIMKSKKAPAPIYKAACRSCSLIDVCQPKHSGHKKIEGYLQELLG